MIFSNKNIRLALVAIFLVVSCSKVHKVHCKDLIEEIPVYISFVGYTAENLDTIIRENYSLGSNFSGISTIDTFINSKIIFKNDTGNSILSSGKYTECKIYLAGANDTFFINDIKYNVADEWDDIDCHLARLNPESPYQIMLNGQIVHSDNYHSIYLKR